MQHAHTVDYRIQATCNIFFTKIIIRLNLSDASNYALKLRAVQTSVVG